MWNKTIVLHTPKYIRISSKRNRNNCARLCINVRDSVLYDKLRLEFGLKLNWISDAPSWTTETTFLKKWSLTSKFERQMACSVRYSVFDRPCPVPETLTWDLLSTSILTTTANQQAIFADAYIYPLLREKYRATSQITRNIPILWEYILVTRKY